MHVNGKHYKTLWLENEKVCMIEQNLLPFDFKIITCHNYSETCNAIKTMIVRGAGAIGVAAGFAMAQAFLQYDNQEHLFLAKETIEKTRPTARNLFYAVEKVFEAGRSGKECAIAEALRLAEEDTLACQRIGQFGNELLENNSRIETHCNAGWLAFTDYGSALSPVYTAKNAGKNIFVYVDETRPRSQGARLTAWELKNENIPHQIVPDNAGAHLMSLGKVDIMIVGADRIAANGDAANKIGTLEKAIAAYEFGIPFYIAAPLSTFDLNCGNGTDIPIEERNDAEVLYQTGPDRDGKMHEILVCSPGSSAWNPAFDVTPAKFISGIITEKGICKPDALSIKSLFQS
jgi:S-methyl-5-thioribose-1-phosphate isomerase